MTNFEFFLTNDKFIELEEAAYSQINLKQKFIPQAI